MNIVKQHNVIKTHWRHGFMMDTGMYKYMESNDYYNVLKECKVQSH